MRILAVLFALGLVLPIARQAYAKKYTAFELKELHEARAQRKADKEELQREEQEDAEAAARQHAHAHVSSTHDRMGPDETEHLRDDE